MLDNGVVNNIRNNKNSLTRNKSDNLTIDEDLYEAIIEAHLLSNLRKPPKLTTKGKETPTPKRCMEKHLTPILFYRLQIPSRIKE